MSMACASLSRAALPGALRAPVAPSASRGRVRVAPVRALGIGPEYGYVLASCASTAALCQWLAIKVAFARRDSGVAYPAMYATGDDEASVKFNCTQRAHQNTLETAPAVLALVALLGLQHPITAAALGVAWNLGRVLYANGYSTGDPKKRAPGSAIAGVIYLALIVATLVTGLRVALPA